MNNTELDKLTSVIDEIDPTALSHNDIDEIKKWGADKIGLLLVDLKEQKILWATEGAERIFGYVTDQMVGLDLVEVVPDAFREVHIKHVEEFTKHMQIKSMGYRDKRLEGRERDGMLFPAEVGLFPRSFKGRDVCLANVVRLSKEI